MRIESRRVRWSWVTFGFGLLAAGGLSAGCGGASDGGDSNYSQVFEKPEGPAPKLKLKPVKPLSIKDKDLSPRERRELEKSQ
jgi:hypothetical protein